MKLKAKLFFLILLPGIAVASGSHDHSHDHDHDGAKFSVGEPGKGTPDRVVRVSMQDSMRFVFDPPLDKLRHGEVIEFLVSNDGAIQHEFSIGNAEDQVAHAEMMRKMPDMKHEDPNTVSLAAGETARLKWRFMGDDTVVFACNIPGHFEAGMKHEQLIFGEK
jgi:uncharacterized cupredoxin-like copper-binding protein